MPTGGASDEDTATGTTTDRNSKTSRPDASTWVTKAIEVLGPRVPENVTGLIIITVLLVSAVVIIGVTGASVIVLLGVFALAIVAYTLLILVPGRKDRPRMSASIRLEELLSDEQHDAVCAAVAGGAEQTATSLGVEPHLIRGNIFGSTTGGLLKIIPGLSHNMQYPKEYTMRMCVNEGSTGHAWHRRRPNIAVRPLEEDGLDILPPNQMARVEPRLQWIISVPVFTADDATKPTWVFNVDGLEVPKTLEQLELAVGALLRWAEQIARVLRSIPKERLKGDE